MQKCGKCDTAFTWGLLYTSFWLSFKPVDCKNCGTTHEVTTAGRFKFIALTVIPFLIANNLVAETRNVYFLLGIAVVIVFLISFLTPFIVNYKVDKHKELK